MGRFLGGLEDDLFSPLGAAPNSNGRTHEFS